MKISLLAAAGLLSFAMAEAAVAAAPNDSQLMKLAPQARLEQRCNARAMGLVGREHKGFHPDELVAYAFGDTAVSGNAIEAPGGALRSGGKWYRVSYDCKTSDDGLQIEAFHYTLGEAIPREEWADHYLVP